MYPPCRHLPWLILLLINTLAIGCRSLNPSTPDTAISDNIIPGSVAVTPTVSGLSRERPLPRQDIISLPNWDVSVLEIVRGPSAWQQIRAANQFNEPAPDGWSYILIKYRLQRKGNNSEESSLGLNLTGDANILHYSFNTSAVPPEPILDPYLMGGETSEGWEAYLIREDEGDLMLVLADHSDYELPDYFVQLDENARLAVPDSLAAIEPTAVGREPNDPTLFGQIATSDDWQMTVQQIQQGEEAWRRIQAANPFNEPPAPGQDYLLVQMWVHYIGADPLGAFISSWDFDLINREQAIIHNATVSGLDNSFPYVKLYPDGELAGWIAFLVDSDDDTLILIFNPTYSIDDNQRYFSLRQSGR